MAIDLFTDQPTKNQLHPQFLTLRDARGYEPAREVLREIQARIVDPDGNFVEQFQTSGFDSRTFELFLFAMLEENGHSIDRSHDRPDFIVTKDGISASIEAVTANPKPTREHQPYKAVPVDRSEEELRAYLQNDLAIRMGSPLFSKLKKRYWELPHVGGKPLVIAIQCFHEPGSLMFTSTTLSHFLFGYRQSWYHDTDGNLIISEVPIEGHKSGTKMIPSGFFSQPETENISAVLFVNSGTIPKFARMGLEVDNGKREVRMLRYGTCYRHDPNATLPEPFVYEVGNPEEGRETWREGTVLIHNPNALYPLPAEWLGAGAEEHMENGKTVTTFAEPFLPYWSNTEIFVGLLKGWYIHQRANRMTKVLMKQFPPTPR
ncbi:hypothetical protein Jab_2c22910 [Janthinobacterium sp. HH01]|uniref:hypothetical protein n=1 Tax=Janthinobacterium sp. HH01 TaxID=1198452 RepID=UPI0002AE86D7|nr:hypothetical protein [Janthinobacterium sp. HH01]ELX10204.1 hypothetical protein Jab_2c22910 [Janthinobacterium sp. HH01]